MEHKKVLFFSSEKKEKLLSQQYSLTDIYCLKKLFKKTMITNKLFSYKYLDADIYFSWWASGSIIPMIYSFIFSKKIYVVAGGNESTIYFDSITGKGAGYTAYNPIKKFIVRFVLRHATEVICVSNFQKNECLKLVKRDYLVVYNGIDTDTFKPLSLPREYLTMVCNLEKSVVEIKRLKNFIYACSELSKSENNIKVMIVGKHGNAYQEVSELVKELGLDEQFNFIDLVDNAEMPRIYNESKVYVQVSDTETFGVSALEAYKCGCKLVLSRSGALEEVFSDVGFFCNHNDYSDITRSLKAALNSTENVNNKNILNYNREYRLKALRQIIKDD